MGRLAADYPELGAFPADATLMEIKVMYGLSTLAEVREMGRERGRRRASASGEPARQAGQVRPLTAG